MPKKVKRSEASIESATRDYAIKKGCLVYKLGQNSEPDRLYISPSGVCGFYEHKKEGEKPRPLQLHELSKLRKQNCVASWGDSLQHAKAFIDDLCNS